MKSILSIISIFLVLILGLTVVIGVMDHDFNDIFDHLGSTDTDAPPGDDMTDPPSGGDATDSPSGGDATDSPSGGDATDVPSDDGNNLTIYAGSYRVKSSPEYWFDEMDYDGRATEGITFWSNGVMFSSIGVWASEALLEYGSISVYCAGTWYDVGNRDDCALYRYITIKTDQSVSANLKSWWNRNVERYTLKSCAECEATVYENSPHYNGTEIPEHGSELFYFCSEACYLEYVGNLDYRTCQNCNGVVTQSSPYYYGTEIPGNGGTIFYFCSQSCYNTYTSVNSGTTYKISGIWMQKYGYSLNSNELWGTQIINGSYGQSILFAFDSIKADVDSYGFYDNGYYVGGYPFDVVIPFYIDFGTTEQPVSEEFYRAITRRFVRVDHIGEDPGDDDIPVINRECEHCGNSVTETSPYYYGTTVNGQGDKLFYFCSFPCYEDYSTYINSTYQICDNCFTIVTESSPYYHGTELPGHGGDVFYFCCDSCYYQYCNVNSGGGSGGDSGGVTPGDTTLSGTYQLTALGSGYQSFEADNEYVSGVINGYSFASVGYSSGDRYIEFYDIEGHMGFYIPVEGIDYILENEGVYITFVESQTPSSTFLTWFNSAFVSIS